MRETIAKPGACGGSNGGFASADHAQRVVDALNALLEAGHLRDPENTDQAYNVSFDEENGRIRVEVEGDPIASVELGDFDQDGYVEVAALGIAVLESIERYRNPPRA